MKFSKKDQPFASTLYPEESGTNYLEEFLREINGTKPAWFSTEHVLNISATCLKLQELGGK